MFIHFYNKINGKGQKGFLNYHQYENERCKIVDVTAELLFL